MANQTIRIDVKPHEGQVAIHGDPARFKIIAAGRRWGKTRLGVMECIDIATRGRRAWWISPNYKMSEVGWRPLRTIGHKIGAEIRLADKQVNVNGGFVQVRSADDPQVLRGEGLDYVYIDEAAHIAKLEDVWQQSIRPALSDRLGSATFGTTPDGFNYFYELFRNAQTDDTGAWSSFNYPSWTNPYLPQSEIDAARKQLPALVFRQEYGAEFVQLAGALFRREWFDIIDAEPEISRWVRYWDLAVSTKQSADYTAGAKVGMTDSGIIVISDVARSRWEWPDALRIIGNTARSDGQSVAQGIESVGVQKGMHQALMREPALAGLAFIPIQVNKDKMIRCQPWLARAEQGKVALVRGSWNAAFLDEACAFPETTHDDQVDAVSGGVQMIGDTGPLVYWGI